MPLLFVLGFLLSAGNGAIFALLPEIQDTHGLPTWSLGVIVASAFGAGLVSQLALARYADRGHARRMLVTGTVLAAAGYLVTGVGTEVWQVAGGRGLAGLGIGMVFPAARKIVVTLQPDAVGAALGRFLAVDVAGFVLGAPIAAVIAEVASVPIAFAVLAFGGLACVPAVARAAVPVIASVPAAAGGGISTGQGVLAGADRRVLRRLFARREIRAGLALGTATFGAIGTFDTIWARYLTDLGATPLFIGFTLTCFGLPMAALAGWGGRLADEKGPLRVGIVGVACSVPMMAAYGFTGVLAVLTVLAIAHSILDAVNMPATQAAVARCCAPQEIAAGQGLLSATQLSTAAVASLAVAPIYERYGAVGAFGTAAGVMAVAWTAAALSMRGTAVAPAPVAPAGTS